MRKTVLGLVVGLVAFVMAVDDSVMGVGSVRLSGRLGERLEQVMRNHVLATDADALATVFKEKTERRGFWQTEYWGKYMHAACPLWTYSQSPELKAKIERALKTVLAAQEKSGYIGNYPDELRCGEGWDVWGMKYTMLGLIHYYDAFKTVEPELARKALAAAARLCDYVIVELGPGGRRGRELWMTGNWSGLASSSVLEPVVWLYKRTGEKRYLDFASFVVKGMSEPTAGPRLVDLALKGVAVADRNGYGNLAETHGGYVCKHNRWKAYEMMSCYQGLLDFVGEGQKVEGEDGRWKNLRLAAVMTGEDIVKEEVNLAGGCACAEAWFHGRNKQHLPYRHLQETCVTTTWMRFCEKLLAVTDEPKWADEIERTFYNIYLAALKSDGSHFSSYVPLSGYRSAGGHQCDLHQNCCNANGPRGFLCFLKAMFVTKGSGATFNFYASARARGTAPETGKALAFDVYTLYPQDNVVRIESHTEGAGVVPLRLRIPAWSEKTVIRLNGGKPLEGVRAGSYHTIERDWKLGDRVEIAFDMACVAHTIADAKESVPGPFAGAQAKAVRKSHYVAFTYGPILLARDSRFGDGDLSECLHRQFVDGARQDAFVPVTAPSADFGMAFSATLPIGMHTENPEGRRPRTIRFCDYASAGNRWGYENYYRTWLPIDFGPTE